MGAIQQSIDQTLRIGSALLTQMPVYKRQIEVNDLKKELQSLQRPSVKDKTVENVKEQQRVASNISEIQPSAKNKREAERLTNLAVQMSIEQQKAIEERERKIEQKQAYRDYMRLIRDE